MDCPDPVLEQHFIGHSGPVTSLSFSPNGKQLASSSEDKTFMNWNLTSSRGSLRYRAKPVAFTHVTFSPSGNLIGSSQSQYVRMWMASVQGKSLEFKAHSSTVRSIRFAPDGKTFLTASDDKSLKIWRTTRRKFVSSLIGHTNWVRFGNFSYDGNQVVSCSDDKSTRIWDTRTSKQIHVFNEIKNFPLHSDFHPTKTYVGVAIGRNIKIYDLRTLKLLQYYPCHEDTVTDFSFHPHGNFLLTGSEDKTSKIIDLIEGRAILSLEGHTQGVTAVAFSLSGDNFATGSKDKNVFVWKTNLDGEKEMEENIVKNINGYKKSAKSRISSEKRSSHTISDFCSIESLEDEQSKKPSTSNSKSCFSDSTDDLVYDPKKYQYDCNQEENIDKENLVNKCLKGAGENIKPIENSLGKLLSSVDSLSSRMNDLEKKISVLEIINPMERGSRFHSY